MDVIELDRKRDNDDDDDDEQNAAVNHHDPLGYDEVLQTIRAIIWSNVDMKKKMPQPKIAQSKMTQPRMVRTAEANGANDETDAEKDDVDANMLEAELSGFEQLLTEVMTFKETTASWSRNERLAYAEKFAGKYIFYTF